MKIIEGHAHVCEHINGYGAEGELQAVGDGFARYASGKRICLFPEGMGNVGCPPESLLNVMDRYGVEKAVLLQGMYLGFQKLYTHEAVRKYPDRFVGAATYDPFARHRQAIVRHLFDELGFTIIKMELSNSSGLMANHDTVDLDGMVMHEVYQMAAERNLVFVIDIGRPGNDCHQVDNLRQAVRRYPDMKFVICHLGSHQRQQADLLRENLEKLRLPNVWFDLAAVPNNTKPETFPYPTASAYVRIAREIVGVDRLIWGSDMPTALNDDSYEHLISYLRDDADWTSDELAMVFYRNAESVYFRR
ncbi:MAG: amidohydrolase family protein [bacterium]